MTLAGKIDAARAILLAASQRQDCAFFASFGKDSLVTMHLARDLNIRSVVRIPNLDETASQTFIDTLCAAWGLAYHALAPGRALFTVYRGTPEFLSLTALTPAHTTAVPLNLPLWKENDPRMLVCVDEELRATRGVCHPPSVGALVAGLKRGDLEGDNGCKSILNQLPPDALRAYIDRHHLDQPMTEIVPGVPLYLPLLDWTDDDVWEYIDRFDVPLPPGVYDPVTKAKRPPVRAWCYRCHDPQLPHIVHCPKLDAPILNFAADLHDADLHIERLRRLSVVTAAEATALTTALKPAKIADVQVYRPQIEDFKLAKLWHAMVTSGDITAFPPSYCVLLSFMQMMQPPTTLVYEEDDDGIWLAVWIEPSTWDFSTAGLWLREDKRKSPGAYEAIRLAFHHFFTKTNAVIAYTLTEARAREYMKFGFEYRGIMPGVALGGDLHQLVLTRDRFESVQSTVTGEA